jgi:hypothetical protein
MKFFALAGLVAGSVVGAVSSGSALTVEWRDADGVPCDVVCGASYFAVSSGRSVHPDARLHGRTFYVCRANAGEQGLRPGYNLRRTGPLPAGSAMMAKRNGIQISLVFAPIRVGAPDHPSVQPGIRAAESWRGLQISRL